MQQEPRDLPGAAVADVRKHLLAIDPSFGSVYVCNQCNRVHLGLGDTQLMADIEGFQSLAVLLQRAAANFESWAEYSAGAASNAWNREIGHA